jgi:hypothetical protein
MATAQGLLNNVLRGLRRDIVSGTTNSYHLLLIQFLNIAKDTLEQKWDWHALRSTVTVTVTASTETFTLSAAGAADIDVGDKARLLYEKHVMYANGAQTIETSEISAGAQPQVFDVSDSTEYRMQEIPWERFERLRLTDDGETTAKPQYFALRRVSGFYQLGIWPMASGSRTLKMRFVIPQAVIPSADMEAYTLSIPDGPVWMRALWMAAQERGEDTGRPLSTLEQEYMDSEYYAYLRERGVEDNTMEVV